MTYNKDNFQEFLTTPEFEQMFSNNDGEDYFNVWAPVDITDFELLLNFISECSWDNTNEYVESGYLNVDHKYIVSDKIITITSQRYIKDGSLCNPEYAPDIIVDFIKKNVVFVN